MWMCRWMGDARMYVCEYVDGWVTCVDEWVCICLVDVCV